MNRAPLNPRQAREPRLVSMAPTRRSVVMAAAVMAATGDAARAQASRPPMYGVISQMTAAPGRRDELAAILIEGTRRMPGCLSYVVAADAALLDALWITEVWADKASHDASLRLPQVQAAIAKGRPLIASFGARVETTPLGGAGVRPAD